MLGDIDRIRHPTLGTRSTTSRQKQEAGERAASLESGSREIARPSRLDPIEPVERIDEVRNEPENRSEAEGSTDPPDARFEFRAPDPPSDLSQPVYHDTSSRSVEVEAKKAEDDAPGVYDGEGRLAESEIKGRNLDRLA